MHILYNEATIDLLLTIMMEPHIHVPAAIPIPVLANMKKRNKDCEGQTWSEGTGGQ